MAGVTRKVDIPISPRPKMDDMVYLLKEGRIVEYLALKAERERLWKENRYRACLECNEVKLRSLFQGQSKYCSSCNANAKKTAPSRRNEYKREYQSTERGAMYKHAKQVVYHLKKMGLLVPAPCEKCASLPVHAHHPDYNRPWEVMWLCAKHHVEWHNNNEPTYV